MQDLDLRIFDKYLFVSRWGEGQGSGDILNDFNISVESLY